MGGAAVALVAGVVGGLALLVDEIPAPGSFIEQHGPLMALGFLGTLIVLERAVALRRLWGYAAPAFAAAGAVALAVGAEQVGRVALTAGGGWLVAIYLALLAGLVAYAAGGLLSAVGRRFGLLTVAVFLPVQLATGVAIAWHKGVTWASLAEPGYGRILAAKLALFCAVMAAAGVHGWATGRGRPRLARAMAVTSLVGSLGVVLLATALPAS